MLLIEQKEKVLVEVLETVKQVVEDKKVKIQEVVEELELTLKVDKFHYIDVYLREVSQMQNSKLLMQLLMLAI